MTKIKLAPFNRSTTSQIQFPGGSSTSVKDCRFKSACAVLHRGKPRNAPRTEQRKTLAMVAKSDRVVSYYRSAAEHFRKRRIVFGSKQNKA